MPDYFKIHARGIQSLQTVLADACPSFIWAGQTWKALPGGARKSLDQSLGGFSLDSDLSITCLVAQFGRTADAQRELMLNKLLTYLGKQYRIRDVIVAAGAQQLRLLCVDAQQGV